MEKRIALQEGMSEVQTVKTLIHEMAYQKLHDTGNAADSQSRSSKEVEAESVAYTVCQHYGIDTSDYSFSYVAGWSEGKEMKELKASLNRFYLFLIPNICRPSGTQFPAYFFTEVYRVGVLKGYFFCTDTGYVFKIDGQGFTTVEKSLIG